MKAIGDDFSYGCLRSLRLEDADGMLEWMHDEDISQVFNADFMSMVKDDVEAFIKNSWTNQNDIHFAVVDDEGGYLGTISLKNIDLVNENAEYAISMRKVAQGTGKSLEATKCLLNYAFDVIGLHRVYLNVLTINKRAIRFYEKVGFAFEGIFKQAIKKDGEFLDLAWYAAIRGNF